MPLIHPDRVVCRLFKTSTPELVYRYIFHSLSATLADLLFFFILLHYLETDPVPATLSGNLAGTLASFYILHFWVFRHSGPRKMIWQMSKFAVGTGIIISVNVGIVALLHHYFILNPWTARLSSGLVAWCVGYTYNRKVVFKTVHTSYAKK